MRGRTNITGGGMNLNATVDEFTVAEGNDITSGDFVEYYTTVSERTLISSSMSILNHTKTGNGLCLGISDNVLYLFEETISGLEIVGSYNDYVVSDYELLTDGTVAICVKGSPFVIRLKIIEKRFQYICSATGIPEGNIGNNDGGFVSEYGGKLYLFNTKNKTVSGRTNAFLSLYTFDISSETSVIYQSGEPNTEVLNHWSDIDVRYSFFGKPIFCNGFIYVPYKKVDSYSSIYSTISKFAIVEGSLSCISFERIYMSFSQYAILIFDKYILWVYHSGVPSVYIYNTRTGISVSYSLKDFGFSVNTNTSNQIAFSEMNNGKIAVFCAGISNQNGVLQVSEFTGDLSLVSNIFETNIARLKKDYIGVIYLDGTVNDITYYNGKSSVRAVSYDSYAEILTEKVDENYVKTYGGGKAIGVAKQSGKSGQKIEVYVPTPA